MTTLAEFLKEYGQKLRDEAPERLRKRDEWVQAVDRLLRKMEEWLQQGDPEHVLRVERRSVELLEENIGAYSAPALAIYAGARKVDVVPVARNVLGPMDGEFAGSRAHGRVDLKENGYDINLYRRADDRGEFWFLIDDEFFPRALDRERFETALVKLLK